MPEILPPSPSVVRRLYHTPVRDVLRGRVTGRLDWRRTLAAADLPQPAKALITRVVCRTRLWRSEKADVANELVAHFADGLAAGTAAETLVTDFGDEPTAARLIRRAKRRGRPAAVKAVQWAGLAVGAGVFVYAGLAARFLFARPTPTVDYLASMNAPILAVPEQDRAWPLYRRVIVDAKLYERGDRPQTPWWVSDVIDWPATEKWIDAHAADVERIRAAAAKPHLGFVLGGIGSAYDKGMLAPRPADLSNPPDGALVDVLLPHLNAAREMTQILAADARFGRQANDADRVRRDLHAMLGMGHQLQDESSGLAIISSVAVGMRQLAFDEIERTLLDAPQLMTDNDLIGLSHALAGPRTAGDLIKLDGERALVLDIVQRVYTDDGHGDGRLTRRGMAFAERFSARFPEVPDVPPGLGRTLLAPAAAALGGSRRRAVESFEQASARAAAALARPQRERPPAPTWEFPPRTWVASDLFNDDLGGLQGDYSRIQIVAERMLARRDAVQAALAMELFRRRHNGAWPASLDELTPTLLPAVPVDPVTGGPVRFKIENNRPLVYSVGGDGDDDNGRPPTGADGKPVPDRAAEWPVTNALDGDWPLFPQRPDDAAESP